MPSFVSLLRSYLPRGSRLPARQWEARHRALLVIVAAHVPVMIVWGLLAGFPLWHAVADVLPIVVPAAFAANPRLTRRAREGAAALGLLDASAVLVHLMDGAVEAHFHFFLAVALLALYEEWFPYLLAFGYVFVHHLTMSLVSSSSVFNHPDAVAHPLKWSLIHAFFIGAQGVISLVGWKVNEDSRRSAARGAERFARAFTDAPIGMALVDMRGTVREANGVMDRRWQQGGEGSLVGRPVADLISPPALATTPFPGVSAADLAYADGSGWGHWRHAPLHDEEGIQVGWITHCIDITRRRALEHDLSWRAHHDPLTGLANRTQMAERLDERLKRDSPCAVAFIDIDDFKLINDSLGHDAGDELLRALAERLQATTAPSDVVARFGGDEFVLLLDEQAAAAQTLQRITQAIREPYLIGGQPLQITASVGLRESSAGDGDTTQVVLRDADAAMYQAKRAGKAGVAVFDATLREQAATRLELERSLHTVLDGDGLSLVYQPIFDFESGRTCAVEALLRWTHPTLGFVSPADFIPLAEQNGTINQIGAWVLDAACNQLFQWEDHALRMSINVASQQLASGDLVAQVEAALTKYGIEPSRLCLEITETAALGQTGVTTQTLAGLRDLGVLLAVDDFGVGHASLSHLRQLMPVDILKIDKSFTDRILTDPEDAAIVQGMIGLANALGLAVVAEGIETPDQAQALTAWGCHKGQGYHFSKPITPGQVAARLADEQLVTCATAPSRTLRVISGFAWPTLLPSPRLEA